MQIFISDQADVRSNVFLGDRHKIGRAHPKIHLSDVGEPVAAVNLADTHLRRQNLLYTVALRHTKLQVSERC